MTLPMLPPPPRARMASGEIDVYQKLIAIETRMANLEQAQAVRDAGTRNQTLQIIAGCVAACVTAVVGSRVTAPTPPPTQTVVQTSAYDRALDACKQIQTETDRAVCIVKVAHDAAGLPPR